MRRPSFSSFLHSFIDGFAVIGEGMANIASFGRYSSRHRSYEERFGTDAELLASDWKNVGDDLRKAMQQEDDSQRQQ